MAESETVELKKSTSELKAGIVSLVAMLNKHKRGELWFGIKMTAQPSTIIFPRQLYGKSPDQSVITSNQKFIHPLKRLWLTKSLVSE
ncbi:MAG: hypothetical protein ABFD75_03680 [Smithella sp.]